MRSRTLWLALALTSCLPPAVESKADGGVRDAGSGLAPVDAGAQQVDAGAVPFDAGAMVADAGPSCVLSSDAGVAPFSATYVFIHSGSILQDKLFYLLTVFDADPRVRVALAASATMSAHQAAIEGRFLSANERCGTDAACYRTALRLTDVEVAELTSSLAGALGECLVRDLAQRHLRPSGVFIRNALGTDEALIAESFRMTAQTLNQAFETHAAGLGGAQLRDLVASVAASAPRPLAAHEPLLRVVLAGMAAGARDEAARYEPLASGLNAPAIAALASTNWAAYKYTLMVVPGQGPTGSEALSPIGRARCDLAASNFSDHDAPFILLSGGHVHPDRTEYSEAIEMRKYLISSKGIPESAIFVDPFARHTTTNLRNASRFILRLGLPTQTPAIVTSDAIQSFIITSELTRRSQAELGYVPYFALSRVNSNDVSFLANPEALQVDARDTLDP